MNNLIKHNDIFNDLFPTWANWDRFDNYLFNNDPWTTGVANRPKNKYRWDETDEAYTLDIVMPGMTKKDIDLTFKEGTLTIRCKKDVSGDDQQFLGVKTEQVFRNFPRAVNADKVSAEMKEGILYIRLPKQESDKAKTIDIR
jgi:HSP20 family protein|tara:strand:+ start:807 stop:1232 length:426 start_codon:yes stop_codon:yes gene_type:complete